MKAFKFVIEIEPTDFLINWWNESEVPQVEEAVKLDLFKQLQNALRALNPTDIKDICIYVSKEETDEISKEL